MRPPRTTSFPAPCRRAPGPRLVRRLGSLLLVVALAGLSGCGLRLGQGTPASLPSVSQSEAVRDSLARQAVLIASCASAVAESGSAQSGTALEVQSAADTQAEALGGVWEPWATTVPSSFPTASPVATADDGATVEDLATALEDGTSLARDAALAADSAQDARLYTALATSWSTQTEALSPGTVPRHPRSSLEPAQSVSPELVVAYDKARYTLQEVAARSDATTRERAFQEAEEASAVVNAALAAGSEDTRLAAYAAPAQATESSDPDTAWAQAVWSDVTAYEVQEAGSTQAGSSARTAAVEAAADAALRATAWGAGLAPLPGYSTS